MGVGLSCGNWGLFKSGKVKHRLRFKSMFPRFACCASLWGRSPLLPTLCHIWPQTGAACTPEYLVAALHDRLNMVISNIDATAGDRSPNTWRARACELLADFLAGIGEILAGNEQKDSAPHTGATRRFLDA